MMLYQKLIMRVISYIIFCFMLFFPVSVSLENAVARAKPPSISLEELEKMVPATEEEKKQLKEFKIFIIKGQVELRTRIDRAIKEKIFIKVVKTGLLPKVWVDKRFYLQPYEIKSKILAVVYFYYITISKKNSIVVIKDGYTGKRIGSYDERGLILK